MEQITGLRRPAVIGRPIWDVIFQIMPREKRTAEFQRFYAEQWQVEVHRQYAHKDTLVDFLIEDHQGNRKIVQSNPFTVETSQGVIGGVIMRDVTVQKQAETALRESEERFHQLFETAMDGIVLTRPDGTIHSANPAALSRLSEPSCSQYVIFAARSMATPVMRHSFSPSRMISNSRGSSFGL